MCNSVTFKARRLGILDKGDKGDKSVIPVDKGDKSAILLPFALFAVLRKRHRD